MTDEAWKEAVDDAYKLGIKEGLEGIDHCFNPFTDGRGKSIDINDDRMKAWSKGWMEVHCQGAGSQPSL